MQNSSFFDVCNSAMRNLILQKANIHKKFSQCGKKDSKNVDTRSFIMYLFSYQGLLLIITYQERSEKQDVRFDRRAGIIVQGGNTHIPLI